MFVLIKAEIKTQKPYKEQKFDTLKSAYSKYLLYS